MAGITELGASEHRPFPTKAPKLVEEGDSYTVSVTKADATRMTTGYTDVARDCDTRARFAAVFVVLTVFPPELDLELHKPAPPPPPPVALSTPPEPVLERPKPLAR